MRPMAGYDHSGRLVIPSLAEMSGGPNSSRKPRKVTLPAMALASVGGQVPSDCSPCPGVNGS